MCEVISRPGVFRPPAAPDSARPAARKPKPLGARGEEYDGQNKRYENEGAISTGQARIGLAGSVLLERLKPTPSAMGERAIRGIPQSNTQRANPNHWGKRRSASPEASRRRAAAERAQRRRCRASEHSHPR